MLGFLIWIKLLCLGSAFFLYFGSKIKIYKIRSLKDYYSSLIDRTCCTIIYVWFYLAWSSVPSKIFTPVIIKLSDLYFWKIHIPWIVLQNCSWGVAHLIINGFISYLLLWLPEYSLPLSWRNGGQGGKSVLVVPTLYSYFQ